jgi:Ca-activated chloride channel family protein
MSSLASVAISGKKSRRHGGRRSRGHMKKARVMTGGIPASYGVFGRRQQDFNTEDYKKIDDNEFKEVTKDPLSTMSIDVDRASYSNIRRFITQGNLPPADAVRVEEMINYFSYEYPQPTGDAPFSINTEFTDCPWNKNHQVVHIGIQGREIKTDKLPANNLVFLIDVSGSMSDPNKLPLVKSGLRLLVDQLRSQDKVSLVVYAGNAGLVLAPTSGSEKEKIMQAIENLDAGGSTAGGQGIELAYAQAKESFIKEGNNRVILATDGDFNVGVSSDGELVRLIEKKREEGVFLTVLGFGTGNYKDSKMEQLADKGNGNYAYIDDILEAKKVLVKEMGGTLLTIAKDVKIQIEFNPAKVKAYRLVGYENRLLNKEDFNDDKKDAGELGSGHTVTAIYEIVPAGSPDQGWASVDELKYQKTVAAPVSATTNEILTVKFRYKEPKEHKSKLITQVVTNSKKNISENCQFACAVAEFGMILRDSKFKGEADFSSVLALAKQSKGKDEDGYRAEFIRLVETAQLLKK